MRIVLNMEGEMKIKILGLIIFVLINIGCMVNPELRKVKIYRSILESMIGRESLDVETTIQGWDFKLFNTWSEENPDADIINKHKRTFASFTKNEIPEIFASKGKYRVMFLMKKIQTESASIGEISEVGTTIMMDSRVTADRYTLIRIVFKDERLVHCKIWSDISGGRLSGQKVIYR